MEGLVALALMGTVGAVVAGLVALVMRFGADSRDGSDWQPHRLRGVGCR